MRARETWLTAGTFVIAGASLAWPGLWVLALLAVALRMVVAEPRVRRLVGLIGLPLVMISFGRFAFEIAPKHFDGVDIERNAVDRVREIYWAESQAHRFKLVGEGEYVSFPELVGEQTARLRDRAPLLKPGLYRLVDKERGIYESQDYFFAVYLPGKDGQPTSRSDQVDTVAATRSFAAYAWPANTTRGPHKAYFVDQFEQLCESDNPEGFVALTKLPEPAAYALIASSGVSFCGRDDEPGPWRPWALRHKSWPWSKEEVNEKKPRAER